MKHPKFIEGSSSHLPKHARHTLSPNNWVEEDAISIYTVSNEDTTVSLSSPEPKYDLDNEILDTIGYYTEEREDNNQYTPMCTWRW